MAEPLTFYLKDGAGNKMMLAVEEFRWLYRDVVQNTTDKVAGNTGTNLYAAASPSSGYLFGQLIPLGRLVIGIQANGNFKPLSTTENTNAAGAFTGAMTAKTARENFIKFVANSLPIATGPAANVGAPGRTKPIVIGLPGWNADGTTHEFGGLVTQYEIGPVHPAVDEFYPFNFRFDLGGVNV